MRAESASTPAAGPLNHWTSLVVLLAADQDASDPSLESVGSVEEVPTGVRLERFTDPAAMLLAVGADPPDLIVLDSHVSGVNVAELARVLSSVADVAVCVGVWPDDASKYVAYRALGRGARGLLPMPVTGTALHDALKSVARTRAGRFTRLHLGSLVMVEESRDVRVRGVHVHLAEREFGLLRCLVRAHPKPVPFADLREGCPSCGPHRIKGLGATVGRLRRRLDDAVPGASEIVGTIRGLGYVAREFV